MSLDDRRSAATGMLSDLLDEELSEAQLGIPAGLRAHLDRFRSYLMSTYTNRVGYYPPRAFDPSLCRTMRDDFESLYELLVDYSHSASDGMPSVASGGICTLQLVNTFDKTKSYAPRDHPLPLLPEFEEKASSWLTPWRSRTDKMRRDQKLLAHAALIKASHWREDAFRNDLVRAYRTFEEETIFSPNKADKLDRVSLVDGRKVRWILVYAVYQVLLSITSVPPEVYDATEAPYHVAIGTDTDSLVPWAEAPAPGLQGLLTQQQDNIASDDAQTLRWAGSAGHSQFHVDGIEIKPDIDYLALSHRDSPTLSERSGKVGRSMSTGRLGRASAVKPRLSSNSTVRRSLRMFRASSTGGPRVDGSSCLALSPKPIYHEIMVQGYGNGLNSVSPSTAPSPAAHGDAWQRSNSTASKSSAGDGDSVPGSADSGDTVESSSLVTPILEAGQFHFARQDNEFKSSSQGRRQVMSMTLDSPDKNLFASGMRRTGSLLWPARRSEVKTDVHEDRRGVSQPRVIAVQDDWAAMQAFMDGVDRRQDDAWEQYASIGGLTEMR
jgi:hypothetical protein